jgi:hypothetical protein
MNIKHAADQLGLLGQCHTNATLRTAASNLTEVITDYLNRAAAIAQEVMPKYRSQELAKAKATVQQHLNAFKQRVEVETRRSQPTLPQPGLTKAEMAEVRGIVLHELLMPGKSVVDPVKLGVHIANKDAAVLHSLLHAPLPVLSPDDTQRVMDALSEQTSEQKQSGEIAQGLSGMVLMVERAMQ